jgi:DNA repair protein RecN (Recombination protein N)
MLTDLQISNFAIIEEQTVSFGAGLNVISGETGAGKSIILSAIELVLGGRASAHVVREGAEALEVQAVFDLRTIAPEVRAELPDYIQGDDLVVSRTITESGKGKVFINGKLASVSLLQDVVGKIVSLCKQGQQMRLLEKAFHTEIVDLFGGLADLRHEYQSVYHDWIRERDALEELEKRLADGEARREDLLDRIKELSKAAPSAGLRDQLEQRVKLLRNSEKVIESYQLITETISAEPGLLSLTRVVSSELERIHQHDASIQPLCALIESVRAELMELDSEISDRAAEVSVDDRALEKMESQLAELARLQRKYRTDDQGLVGLLTQYQEELRLIDNEGAISQIRKRVVQLNKQARAVAERLSVQRRSVTEKLSRLVEPELHELNMPGARLSSQFVATELGSHGLETLELMMATNKGEPLKPLKQVASGGELSRILLVLKKVLQERSGVHVLIFDEIDAGVSGGVARAVGEKLKSLSQHSQVLCITHLPQIASLADKHLLVEKQVGKRTVSVVKELNNEQKIDEIARMLAGYKITAASRESARELLSSK